MDLAVYISELLNEQGAVPLPGLGILKQVRVAGYYNDAEGKFYPPHFVAGFDAQPENADLALAQYISDRNKVSPGSARFFVNKYVADVEQQVDFQEVPVGQLGHLYKQNGKISFKPNTTGAIASAAYGFSAVNLRPEPEPLAKPVPPVIPPAQPVQPAAPAPEPVAAPVPEQHQVPEVPAAQPVVTTPLPPAAPQQVTPPVTNPEPKPVAPTEYRPGPVTPEPVVSTTDHNSPQLAPETEETHKSSWNVGRWVVVALIIIVAAVGGAAIYRTVLADKENEKTTEQANAAIENTPSTGIDTVVINNTPAVADTAAVSQPTTDSATNQPQAQPAQPDTAPSAVEQTTAMPPLVNDKNYKFTLLGGAYDTREQATTVVNQYKAKGVNAAVLINPPSKRFKVTFGYFKTFADGQQAKLNLVQTKQLPSAKLYVETIRQNPKK